MKLIHCQFKNIGNKYDLVKLQENAQFQFWLELSSSTHLNKWLRWRESKIKNFQAFKSFSSTYFLENKFLHLCLKTRFSNKQLFFPKPDRIKKHHLFSDFHIHITKIIFLFKYSLKLTKVCNYCSAKTWLISFQPRMGKNE